MKGARKKRAASKLNYDLFSISEGIKSITPRQAAASRMEELSESRLPSVVELYQLFGELNRRYFNGGLPPVRISYSDRMLNAGSYTPCKREIRIGLKYHKIFRDEVEDTLKHEMIHIIYFRHDANFKTVAARIGASLRAKSHPELRRRANYVYICPSCKRVYPRRKRLRESSCGVCSPNGKFDPRFKLTLLKP